LPTTREPAELVFADSYSASQETGGFILVNPGSNATAATVMIH
jgi:sulfate adenylyltransferase subunit 1 (EFTu-like GTPase family)